MQRPSGRYSSERLSQSRPAVGGLINLSPVDKVSSHTKAQVLCPNNKEQAIPAKCELEEAAWRVLEQSANTPSGLECGQTRRHLAF